MKAAGERLTAWLTGAVQALESRRGRRVFWIVVAVYGAALGAYCVRRAEIPRKVFVERLRYDSPVLIGSRSDEQAQYGSSEFISFRRLSWGAVKEGLDPYKDLDHPRAYPPFFAIAFFPFSVFWRWRGVGSALFFLVGYGGGLLTAWWLASWPGAERRGRRFGLFALIWILLAPFTSAVLARCETDMLVVAPIAAALLLLARDRRPLTAGALLGFAACFKVLPGLFGVYLLCQRRWRAALGMFAAGVVCMVVLPLTVWGPRRAVDLHRSWYDSAVAPCLEGGAPPFIGRPYRVTNQSLAAAVHRFLTPIRAGRGSDMRKVNLVSLSTEHARLLASLLRAPIGLGLLALWIVCRREGQAPAVRASLFATVPLGMLLLSEVSITTHHVSLIVPVGVLITRAVALNDETARGQMWAVAAALGICFVGMDLTVRLLSPFLAATLLLGWATVAVVLCDWRAGGERIAPG